MTNSGDVVATFASHLQAEAAIKELKHAAFDLKKLSIVGRDYHVDENVVGYYNAGERIKYWGGNGAFWGAIWSALTASRTRSSPTPQLRNDRLNSLILA
ncbi:MAG: general stress protein [Verrucomicrobium sp.]|nr:general stress protein [Verrucomicrobium sp.]